MKVKFFALMMSSIWLAGCAMNTPPAIVHQPMTARPEPMNMAYATAPNGSIYQAGVTRPLFEDRRARFIGDTLIVNLVENTSAQKKSQTNAERKNTLSGTPTSVIGLPLHLLTGMTGSGSGDNKFNGSGDSSSNNALTGTITVTVVEVLNNGNLIVSGEKQLAINQGTEFIRFSGVVNPSNVTGTNTVQSTQVADARIEYKGCGVIDESQTMGWLSRFFLAALPF